MRKTDLNGMFGIVCDHGIVHTIIMMDGGENWRYATASLLHIMRSNTLPAAFFYDINCRYSPHFQQYLQSQQSLPPAMATAAAGIHMPLPPFHAGMHNAQCRQLNSLSNRRFPAWCNPQGEPCEQKWAQIGPCKRLKYMSKPNQKLLIQATMHYLNRRQDEKLGRDLDARVRKLAFNKTALQHQIAIVEDSAPEVCVIL